MADIKFEINRPMGVLSEGSKGWQKEINLICWNERKPKLDIREWGPEHERMGKGITLNLEEAKLLLEILQSADLEGLGID